MKVAANISTMFSDLPLLERYAKAAQAGFKLVELPVGFSEPAEKLKAEADKHGLHHVLINAKNDDKVGKLGLAAVKGAQELFKNNMKTTIDYAKILGVSIVHVMSGDGNVKEDEQLYKENLSYACKELAKEGILCVIEPLNSHFRSTYFLNSFDLAEKIVNDLKEPNLNILFDVFHCQLICGQLTYNLKRLSPLIGHIQVSQPPNRNEPDSEGEVNFEYMFGLLKSLNPDWIVGAEYFNTREDASWVQNYGLDF